MSGWRLRGNALAWSLAGLCAWLPAWRHLSTEWSLNEQYQFGWGMPFLSAWIIWRRWSSPQPLNRGRLATTWALVGAGWMLIGLGTLLRWRDPVWRMTGALLALGAVFVTAACFYRLGGRATLRRQAFSVAFACLAIPWPVRIDAEISAGLLRFVTSFSVVLLSLAGIPALQHGHLIELRNGIVGMEEACSGISSLQASLVASVFLGEYFSLSVARRLALGLCGALSCLGANCVRVLGLVLIVDRGGGAAAERWHDSIGGAASVLSFLCLGLIALRLGSNKGFARDRFSHPIASARLAGGDGWAALGGCIALPLAISAGLLILEPASTLRGASWKLNRRDLPVGWSSSELGPSREAAASLHFTRWEACQLLSPQGWSAQVTHLYWNSRQNIPGTAFYHTPALCLSGSGWSTASETQTWKLDVRGRRLAVTAYHLASPAKSLVVAIQCLSMTGDTEGFIDDLNHPTASLTRFALLWRSRARRVDEEILAYMPDLASSDLQRKAFSELLNLTLVPNAAN